MMKLKASCQPDASGVCSQCGEVVRKPRTCPKGSYPRPQTVDRVKVKMRRREPGKVKQLSNYKKAVAKWTAAGMPVREQSEIDRILAICQGCEHYTDEGRPRCKLCGCSINNQPNGLTNKVRMATENCPDDPPKW